MLVLGLEQPVRLEAHSKARNFRNLSASALPDPRDYIQDDPECVFAREIGGHLFD